MRKNNNFFEGIILGGIIGFVVGILFAPSTGDETRAKLKQLKEDNEELINETKEKTENLVSKTLEAIDQGFEKVNSIIEKRKKETKDKD